MILVLTGAPGAGKGTQADLIASRMGFRKVSTGDALRKHIKSGSAIGKKAEAIMAKGELVPDDVLFDVLREELGSDSKERILLDGYPRNVQQAETLASLKAVHPVRAAVHLDVANSELLSRLSGRRVCGQCSSTFHISANPPKVSGICDKCGAPLSQRPDDKPESVQTRLTVYERNTRPVLDYYRGQALYHKVEGVGATEEVFSRLKKVIESLG